MLSVPDESKRRLEQPLPILVDALDGGPSFVLELRVQVFRLGKNILEKRKTAGLSHLTEQRLQLSSTHVKFRFCIALLRLPSILILVIPHQPIRDQ